MFKFTAQPRIKCMKAIRPGTWAQKLVMTEQLCTGPGMTTPPGLVQHGMDHRSPGVVGLTTAGRPGGAGVSTVDSAGAGATARLGDLPVFLRARGGEVIGAGTTIGVAAGQAGATTILPIPAQICTIMTGNSEEEVSIPPPASLASTATGTPTTHGRGNSRADSVDKSKMS